MSGQLPSSPKFKKVTVESRYANVSDVAQSGKKNSRQVGGHLWGLTLTYNSDMSKDEFRPLWAFIMSQQGSYGNFTVIPPETASPRGEGGGSPVVGFVDLVSSGDFGSDTGWTEDLNGSPGGTTVISGGILTVTQGTSSVWMGRYQAISTAIGRAYTVGFDIVSGHATLTRVGVSSSATNPGSGPFELADVAGAGAGQSLTFNAISETTYIWCIDGQSASSSSTFDNISVVGSSNLVGNGTFYGDFCWAQDLNSSSGGSTSIASGILTITQGSNSVWMGRRQAVLTKTGDQYTVVGDIITGSQTLSRIAAHPTIANPENGPDLGFIDGTGVGRTFTFTAVSEITYIWCIDGQSATNISTFDNITVTRNPDQAHSLILSNATKSQVNWLRAGDLISFLGDSKVYINTDDVSTEPDGACHITVYPELNIMPADGVAATVNNVAYTVSLVDDSQIYDVNPPMLHDFELDLIESL